MGLNKRLISTAASGGFGADNFAPVLYTGNSTNDQSITGVGFQPDFVWIKSRNTGTGTSYHGLWDSVRGTGGHLYSSLTNAETNTPNRLYSFDSDGFSLGNGSDPEYIGNSNYVAWCWKAGGAAVDGSGTNVTSVKVSANQDAGFSIVKYNYQSSSAATIEHGLSAAPEMIILKVLDATTASNWFVYHSSLGAGKEIYLNTTGQAASDGNRWNNTSPTSTVFSIGTSFGSYPSYYHGNHITYNFHSVDGYQKVGSYAGNGTNQTINVGFTPRFVMIKASTIGSSYTSWAIFDSERLVSYDDTNPLWANMNTAEGTRGNGSGDGDVLEIIFVTDTGFKLGDASRNANSDELNDPNKNYIYLAIA